MIYMVDANKYSTVYRDVKWISYPNRFDKF